MGLYLMNNFEKHCWTHLTVTACGLSFRNKSAVVYVVVVVVVLFLPQKTHKVLYNISIVTVIRIPDVRSTEQYQWFPSVDHHCQCCGVCSRGDPDERSFQEHCDIR